jgi:hypothetical protein
LLAQYEQCHCCRLIQVGQLGVATTPSLDMYPGTYGDTMRMTDYWVKVEYHKSWSQGRIGSVITYSNTHSEVYTRTHPDLYSEGGHQAVFDSLVRSSPLLGRIHLSIYVHTALDTQSSQRAIQSPQYVRVANQSD